MMGIQRTNMGKMILTDLIILKDSNIIEWMCSQHVHISDVYVYNYIYIFVKTGKSLFLFRCCFSSVEMGCWTPTTCLFFERVETTNQNISYHSPNSWNIASIQYIGKVDLG